VLVCGPPATAGRCSSPRPHATWWRAIWVAGLGAAKGRYDARPSAERCRSSPSARLPTSIGLPAASPCPGLQVRNLLHHLPPLQVDQRMLCRGRRDGRRVAAGVCPMSAPAETAPPVSVRPQLEVNPDGTEGAGASLAGLHDRQRWRIGCRQLTHPLPSASEATEA